MKRSENIILYDTDEFELIPIQDGVNSVSTYRFDLYQRPENIELNKHRNGKKDELKRYINYFKGGWSLFLHRKEYKHIICWQQFYALTFAFFCNIFHTKKTCQVIAGNYTYKEKGGIAKKPYYWFMKKCLDRDIVDYIHIPSNLYAVRICEEFGFNREKIIVHPFGILDEYEKLSKLSPPKGFEQNKYFLAIGRSNRDYDFLIKVWEDIRYPLVIISDAYKKQCDNKYITIRNDVGADDQYEWINNCKANIICLNDGNIASGDTVLLMSMMLERLVIVSSPSTLAEMYVNSGVNGISVAKEVESFRKVIWDTIEGKNDHIGVAARESFLDRFERKHLGKEFGKYVK